MSSPDHASKGADWTHLLSDPDLINHLGQLLRAYRDALPEKRDQVLLEVMRNIKTSSSKPEAPGSEPSTREQSIGPLPAEPMSTPPFDPGETTSLWSNPSEQDRRRHPRQKCFVAVEMRVEGATASLWGNLANTSLGGCFVETATPIESGIALGIGLWLANDKVWVKGMALNGIVTRSSPCFGARVKFTGLDAAERETLRKFLKFIETSMSEYQAEQGYLARLKR
jgi:hypothetical protein